VAWQQEAGYGWLPILMGILGHAKVRSCDKQVCDGQFKTRRQTKVLGCGKLLLIIIGEMTPQ